jgi:2,3-bisphosphoglycerate-independent phosphoglycerate mutase
MGLDVPEAMTGQSLLQGWTDGWLEDRRTERETCQSSTPRRVLLLILDGWGIGKNDATNPIWLADTPAWDGLIRDYPGTQLLAAGDAVGLAPGKAGNSEAGHTNIGAGRVVMQDDARLDLAMQDGSFYTNPVLCSTIDRVRQRGAGLHLIGLLTEKSSHGSIDYPLAILRMARAVGLSRVYLHLILDGRSTQPGSAPAMLDRLEGQVADIGIGQIVTALGRGIALDRDGNYDRTERAYNAIVFGHGSHWPVL